MTIKQFQRKFNQTHAMADKAIDKCILDVKRLNRKIDKLASINHAVNMKTKRRAKITFRKTKAGAQKGEWRYRIFAFNGEPLATSEGYTSKHDAKRGLADLKDLLCV